MTPSRYYREPLEELRFALAQESAQQPPAALRERVIGAATSARSPGVAVGTADPISPTEAYRRTAESFDAVLGELSDAGWHTLALRGLDVQGLVGHLIGVERLLHEALGIGPTLGRGTDHVESTQGEALAQAGRPPAETRSEWRQLVGRTVDHVLGMGPAARSQPVTLHGLTMTLERMLVVRVFETWTHEEDIRRAVGLPLCPPESAPLRLMTEIAVSVLPAGLARSGRPQPGRTARLVLTGPGGGTWQAALDRGTPGPTDVRIVADAVMFCRLVANRVTPMEVGVLVTGDEALAADLLAGAMTLAFD